MALIALTITFARAHTLDSTTPCPRAHTRAWLTLARPTTSAHYTSCAHTHQLAARARTHAHGDRAGFTLTHLTEFYFDSLANAN